MGEELSLLVSLVYKSSCHDNLNLNRLVREGGRRANKHHFSSFYNVRVCNLVKCLIFQLLGCLQITCSCEDTWAIPSGSVSKRVCLEVCFEGKYIALGIFVSVLRSCLTFERQFVSFNHFLIWRDGWNRIISRICVLGVVERPLHWELRGGKMWWFLSRKAQLYRGHDYWGNSKHCWRIYHHHLFIWVKTHWPWKNSGLWFISVGQESLTCRATPTI